MGDRMFPVLETERLMLREITNKDVHAIYNCFSNEEVTRYYGQDPLLNIKQAEEMVNFFSESFLNKRGIRWGIEKKGEQGIIGTVGFNAWTPNHKRAEIGYEIFPDFWRNGYASEAIHKVISYGFNMMNLSRIGAVVFLANEASNQLLSKSGFQKEGILKDYMFQNGESHDTYVYSLLKRNYVIKAEDEVV